MEHLYDIANKGYSFKDKKYTYDELKEILDYSNMAFSDYIDIIRNQNLTEDLFLDHIREFGKYINLYSQYHSFSDDFLKRLYDEGKMNDVIVGLQYISDDVQSYIIPDIHSVIGKIYIDTLIKTQALSEEKILEYRDEANYENLFKYQEIPEYLAEFIDGLTTDEHRKHQIYTVGGVYQKWSDEFIINHNIFVDWFRYYIYPERVRLPVGDMVYFIDDDPNGYYPDDIEWPILSDPDDPRVIEVNNKHKTVEYWRMLITTQFPVYEHNDDYFIGYMIVTNEGYPLSSFKYKLEVGNVYEMHADITSTTYSFGFTLRSLFELEGMSGYRIEGDSRGDYTILLAKVYYEDVCNAVKTSIGYCIRSSKVEIINKHYKLNE